MLRTWIKLLRENNKLTIENNGDGDEAFRIFRKDYQTDG